MDTELATIFNGNGTEFASLAAPSPTIDLTDLPLTPTFKNSFSGNGYSVTTHYVGKSSLPDHDYSALVFNLGETFWNVPMKNGSDPSHSFCASNPKDPACAALNIRQGIAHLIDKSTFVTYNTSPVIGFAAANDNPVPLDNGGLPSPNPCNWDILSNANQADPTKCVVGGPAGISYHLNPTAQGWPGLGSLDLCVAAQHFVDAGLASGYNSNCVLTGLSSILTQPGLKTTPVIYGMSNNDGLTSVGLNLAAEICGLITGNNAVTQEQNFICSLPGCQFPSFCTEVAFNSIPGDSFRDGAGVNWWLWTDEVAGAYPFDKSLYLNYYSQGVGAGPNDPSPPCLNNSVNTIAPADYENLCNQSYDNIVRQMEFSPCLTAAGDPAVGQTSNGPGGTCQGTSQLSAVSAGVQAEDLFGQEAFAIPLWSTIGPGTGEYAYLGGWSNVANSRNNGISNFFTWLNAFSPNPTIPGVVRQGFDDTTSTVDPYLASTPQDFFVVGNIFDSLGRLNPLNNGQMIDWMTVSSSQTPLPCSLLTYTCPAGTTATFRFTLPPYLFFQNGNPVSSFDVVFSYLSLKAYGAFQAAALVPMTGITVLGKFQFDINLAAAGPFTKLLISSPTIIPGTVWSNSRNTWETDLIRCGSTGPCYPCTYTLPPGSPTGTPIPTCSSGFPASDLVVDSNYVPVTAFDPISHGILIGSGPWECNGGTLGTGCAPGNKMNPFNGQSYSFQRFGKGFAPNSPPFDVYFRSNGNLAVYLWTLNTGKFASDFVNFTTMAACFNLPVTAAAPCAHFQNGIGSANGTAGPAAPVGINQVLAVNSFVGVNWVFPFDWRSSTAAPTGIAPILQLGNNPATGGVAFHEGSVNLVDCAFDPVHGYDC
jgi:hypothetical protein